MTLIITRLIDSFFNYNLLTKIMNFYDVIM